MDRVTQWERDTEAWMQLLHEVSASDGSEQDLLKITGKPPKVSTRPEKNPKPGGDDAYRTEQEMIRNLVRPLETLACELENYGFAYNDDCRPREAADTARECLEDARRHIRDPVRFKKHIDKAAQRIELLGREISSACPNTMEPRDLHIVAHLDVVIANRIDDLSALAASRAGSVAQNAPDVRRLSTGMGIARTIASGGAATTTTTTTTTT